MWERRASKRLRSSFTALLLWRSGGRGGGLSVGILWGLGGSHPHLRGTTGREAGRGGGRHERGQRAGSAAQKERKGDSASAPHPSPLPQAHTTHSRSWLTSPARNPRHSHSRHSAEQMRTRLPTNTPSNTHLVVQCRVVLLRNHLRIHAPNLQAEEGRRRARSTVLWSGGAGAAAKRPQVQEGQGCWARAAGRQGRAGTGA